MNARRRATSRGSRRSRAAAVNDARRQLGAPVLTVPSPARQRAGARQENSRGRAPDPLPAAIAADLVAGLLSQRCEPCQIAEAAGYSCTSCGRPTGPADWFRGTSRKTQGDASRARAHAMAETGATALETANPEPLGLWPA